MPMAKGENPFPEENTTAGDRGDAAAMLRDKLAWPSDPRSINLDAAEELRDVWRNILFDSPKGRKLWPMNGRYRKRNFQKGVLEAIREDPALSKLFEDAEVGNVNKACCPGGLRPPNPPGGSAPLRR